MADDRRVVEPYFKEAYQPVQDIDQDGEELALVKLLRTDLWHRLVYDVDGESLASADVVYDMGE